MYRRDPPLYLCTFKKLPRKRQFGQRCRPHLRRPSLGSGRAPDNQHPRLKTIAKNQSVTLHAPITVTNVAQDRFGPLRDHLARWVHKSVRVQFQSGQSLRLTNALGQMLQVLVRVQAQQFQLL